MRYVIGLDIGTTCAKGAAVSEDGQLLAECNVGYALIKAGECVEQRVQDWVEAGLKLLTQLVAAVQGFEPVGISLSTQGASMAAIDGNGHPIGNAITWMDTRSIREADELRDALGDAYVYQVSGWRINPALDAAKIRHIRRDSQFSGAKWYLSTLEIMNAALTGQVAIDPSNASIRQLFDVERGCWDERLLAFADINEGNLCKVLPTGALVGGLTQRVAEATHLPEGLPVYNGAHDQYCAALGAGSVHDGDFLLSAGTTWAMLGISSKPLFTKSYIAPGRHPQEGLYGAMASLTGSGASLQWFKNNFLPDDFTVMNRIVDERRERTQDLYFYPYLAGANYPLWNPHARGAFVGLTLEHDRFDLARAIMEGVCFGARGALDDFNANGVSVRRIQIMGGAAKSDVWCQMVADVTDTPVERLNVTDVCALGAAVIAIKGSGISDSFADAASRMVRPERLFQPDNASVKYYEAKHNRFKHMWSCLGKGYEV